VSANLSFSPDAVPVNTPTPLVDAWTASVNFRKRPVNSRWVDFEWDTASVSVADDLLMERSGPTDRVVGNEEQWRYDGERIELHPSEGEGYWLNLNSPQPCIFVMWRLEEGDEVPRPVVVTVSYNEAGRMLDAGDHVDNVPMPDDLKGALVAYTTAHYKPEPKKKVRRNDPFKEGAFRREPGLGAGHG
jgi:Protein of unknown function (DUF3305)